MTNNERNKCKSGKIRRKRGDTKIGTIEKKYGIDLEVRSDMKISTYLKKNGYKSLTKLINR